MSNDTQTLTLTDFLLARIAEDEADARAFVNDLGEARRWRADEVGGTVRRVGVPPFGLSDVDATTPTHMEAAHIARHNPARVLAECEAKRRIAKWVTGAQAAAGDPPGFDPEDAEALTHVLRLLALPYADHPDYREEWRP